MGKYEADYDFGDVDVSGITIDVSGITINEGLYQGDSEDSSDSQRDSGEPDTANRSAAADLDVMGFGDRVAFLKKVVTRSPLQREIKYKTLKFCCSRRILPEVEDFIVSCPEFASTEQSPFFLLRFLLEGGGLDVLELDEEGNVVTDERKEGLTEDEIDDLVVQFAYETNEIGRELVELMSPKQRLLELLEITPEYYDTFVEVLDFLTAKRSFADVDTLLRGRDVLMVGRDPDDRPAQPSVFVDKLEKAGGIYWEEGWITTEEGREVVEMLRERRGDN